MSDQKAALAKATAAMIQMIGHGQAIQAAVIRGTDPAEVEKMRQDGIAMGEAYFDHTIALARAARALIEGLPDADKLGDEGARRFLD